MNSLEKQHLIKKENLNKTYYFQSILQEACRLKLLTDSEFENIQLQCLQLLAKQTERYTGGESSSIKIETAQNILQSISYSIGVYLKNTSDTDKIVAMLKQKPLSELYQKGMELIKEQLDASKQLLHTIQNDCIITDNIAYNDTIQNGISSFFSDYDAEFASQDSSASIDYPICCDKMQLTGVEYIYDYLQKLSLENQFCKNFTDHDIHCLLQGYNDNYKDLLINIFELVLTNLVGSVLTDNDIIQLNIEPLDRQYLQQKLSNLSKYELDTMLQDASTKLNREFNISDKLLEEHIGMAIPEMSVRLRNALDNNRLDSIFISLKERCTQPVFQFEDGEKINDELFRKITSEIRECRYISDKISIIKREIHSITDLVDIFEGYCIFDNEFFDIFRSFEDMELALLLNRQSKYSEDEKEWHDRLNCFFKEIDLTRRDRIKKLSETINLD